MFRKYLKEIGINEEYWPETVYTSAKSEVRDFREKEYNKYYNKVGVNPAETWNLSTITLMWLYERLVEYRKQTEGRINLEFHTFEVDGKEYTQKQLIEKLIELSDNLIEDGHYFDWEEQYSSMTNELLDIFKLCFQTLWW